ncbi:MAG: PD-(D/E)XK motif protein [Thermoanaerobaculia bacterium]|nr:PD-(D/E)XK motif protein [Thermoanaerobaculia bacterium]
MDQQIETADLIAAWRALSGIHTGEGWQTIPIGSGIPCSIRAGRHFPGNEEALLVAFRLAKVPPAEDLPHGSGFAVQRIELENGPGSQWIGLVRLSAGSLDMFSMVATDLIVTLRALAEAREEWVLHAFLARIRAWQSFMLHGRDALLGPEAEVGLHGELTFLEEVLQAGISPLIAVEAWQGPLGAAQDFLLGAGAIEVKATLSESDFPATIGSLEQLDDSIHKPLFLAALRLRLGQDGVRLSERVAGLRARLGAYPVAQSMFDTRLLHAGYSDAMAERYSRAFAHMNTRTLLVNDDFPRITRATVGVAVRKARYEVDVNQVVAGDIALVEALHLLGVQ